MNDATAHKQAASVGSRRDPVRDVDDLARAIAPHLARILVLLAPPTERPDDLLPLAAAARLAATSVRVLKDASRRGELVVYGHQRDRAVRRDDLQNWIESRRIVHEPIDDVDIEARMRRLGRANSE